MKNYLVYQITNKLNDNIYIGVHVTENIEDNYMGSGTNIGKAIKEFGRENFEKMILYNFDNLEDMFNKEAELVNKEFIKRGDTYNISLGGGTRLTTDTVTVKDKNENSFNVHKEDPRYLSGELVGITKNKVVVKDKNNKVLMIDKNDPKYLSGELVPWAKNMILVKNKNGKTYKHFFIDKEDPRFLSGELITMWTGKKHKEETKKKIGKANSVYQKGEGNSQYGTCWIHHLELKENKKIKKEDLDSHLELGWIKGRKMNIV